jgi:hypothetical protein
MPWSRKFDLPIAGFATLRDAADHIQKLPKAEQSQPHWQFAVEMLHDPYDQRPNAPPAGLT